MATILGDFDSTAKLTSSSSLWSTYRSGCRTSGPLSVPESYLGTSIFSLEYPQTLLTGYAFRFAKLHDQHLAALDAAAHGRRKSSNPPSMLPLIEQY